MIRQHILVVEDEIPLSEALHTTLMRAGYRVTVAHNGKEAIAMLRNSDFDLMVLDIVMPKVDGYKVLEFMEDQGLKMPVLVLSNLNQREDLATSKRLGAIKHFLKSETSLSDIVRHIGQALA